jgi:hypothetical protein
VRRRPQANPRRGFLRAAIAVVVLILIVLGILLLVSSLTAAPAKAPTVPTTPTPSTSPIPLPSSQSSATIPTPRPTTAATESPGKKKDVVRTGAGSVISRALARTRIASNAVASPNRRFVAFVRRGSAYGRNPVVVMNVRTGASRVVGYGDPFVRPVWNAKGTALLFGRVSRTHVFPGARWTLVQAGLKGGSRALASAGGLDLVPLGWISQHPAYLVATATDTAVYTVVNGRPHYISKIITQIVSFARLSPNHRLIAFDVPTNCGFCTIDVFNLDTLRLAFGPSGGPSEQDIAWTSDSRSVVTPTRGGLAVVDAATGAWRRVSSPTGLPHVWPHQMAVTLSADLTLTDTVSGAVYRTRQ